MQNTFEENFKNDSVILDSTTRSSYHLNKTIVVLLGGMSRERDVSINSGKNVAKALNQLGYKVIQVDPGADIAITLSRLKPDIVFNALHGTFGEDGCIQGLLNIMRIPYTNSGVLASSIGMNKLFTRKFLADIQEISLSKNLVVNKHDNLLDDPMPRPYVIKPVSQGSSIGIDIVHPGEDFEFKDYEFNFDDQIIVEEYIKGREINVAVLNGKALGLIEIVIIKGEFYDYTAKYSKGYTKHVYPTDLPTNKREEVLKLSEKIYKQLGCNGIARCEFIYKPEEQKFYFLEINTHPGMTDLSLCAEIAMQQGINFNNFVEQILSSAKYE